MTTELTSLAIDLKERFAEHLVQATDDLLLSLDDTSTDRCDLQFRTGGMVSFYGPELYGTVFVSSSKVFDSELTGEMREDWLREMANQLAGRIKTKLRVLGADYFIAPPLTLHGAVLEATTLCADVQVNTESCRVWAFIHVLGVPNPPAEQLGSLSLKEGDCLLF